MSFILSEDLALKNALAGVVVSDTTDAVRPVPVYFGLPELELRAQTFPYITIDLIDLEEARERVHRGVSELAYVPEGYAIPNDATQVQMIEWPTPFDLTYQVTSWARHPRHDRQILAQLLGTKIPFRFGQVVADAGSTTHNSTVRRLDLLGVAKRDTMDGDRKRLFRNVFTLRMSSELLPTTIPALVGRVVTTEVAGLDQPVEHPELVVLPDSAY